MCLLMPSEKLVPYSFEIYERGNPDNSYNLAQLHAHDTAFAESHILDVMQGVIERLACPSRAPRIV